MAVYEAAFLLSYLITAERDRIKVGRLRNPLRATISSQKPGSRKPKGKTQSTSGRGSGPVQPRLLYWTRRLIHNIVRWENRTVSKVLWTYHMIQALTGHVCFQSSFNACAWLLAHAACIAPAEHTLFRCQNWNGLQAELCECLSCTSKVEDMPKILCGFTFEDLPGNQPERGLALK